jgi:uncharacterized protein (DUF433 family)
MLLPKLDDKKGFVSLLMNEGLSWAEAEDAYDTLWEIYQKYQTVWEGVISKYQALPLHYEILETEGGPQISHSRVMVYDVLDNLNQGVSPAEIGYALNLHPGQVDTAIEYIEQHRPTLEAELAEIKAWQAQKEANYRTIQKEIQKKIRTLPMTAERKAFYELLDKNKGHREQANDHNSE